jgi:hypothetical protein
MAVPVPYDCFIEQLYRQHTQDTRNSWTSVVINTDRADQPGYHWNSVVFGVDHKGTPWAIFLEPLSSSILADRMASALKSKMPSARIKVIAVAVQNDSYSCGYKACYWQILTQMLINDDCIPLEWETPPNPPDAWETVCLRLLSVFDMQKNINHARPEDIGLREAFTHSLDNGTFNQNTMLPIIETYVESLRYEIDSLAPDSLAT